MTRSQGRSMGRSMGRSGARGFARRLLEPAPGAVLRAAFRAVPGAVLSAMLCTALPGVAAAQSHAEPGPPNADAPFTAARITLPPASGQKGGIALHARLDDTARIGLDRTPYWFFFAGGAMAAPLSLVNPFYALGLLLPLVGPPLNAAFNSRRDLLARLVQDEALPARVVAILEELPDLAQPQTQRTLTRLELRITQYGLVARSGQALHTLGNNDDLCLAAEAILSTTDHDGRVTATPLRLGGPQQDPAAPPPLCASLARFTANEGASLRAALREFAELLAALALLRLREPLSATGSGPVGMP